MGMNLYNLKDTETGMRTLKLVETVDGHNCSKSGNKKCKGNGGQGLSGEIVLK
jgi:hypothetical protein